MFFNDPILYHWMLSGSPGGSRAALSGTDGPRPSFVPDVPGIYTARLVVSVGNNYSPPSRVRVTAATVDSPAPAPDPGIDFPRLLAQKNCLACHAATGSVIGPSWADISLRYPATQGNAVTLANNIVRGVFGRWGLVPMPANPQVSADEATQMARWLLRHPTDGATWEPPGSGAGGDK